MSYRREKSDDLSTQLISARNVCLRMLQAVRADHSLFQSLCEQREAEESELKARGYYPSSHVREALDGWRSAKSAPEEATQHALCKSMLKFLGFSEFLVLACRVWAEEFGKGSDLLLELERRSLRMEVHGTAIRALSSRLLRTLVPSRGNLVFVIEVEDLSDSQLRMRRKAWAELGPMSRPRCGRS